MTADYRVLAICKKGSFGTSPLEYKRTQKETVHSECYLQPTPVLKLKTSIHHSDLITLASGLGILVGSSGLCSPSLGHWSSKAGSAPHCSSCPLADQEDKHTSRCFSGLVVASRDLEDTNAVGNVLITLTSV